MQICSTWKRKSGKNAVEGRLGRLKLSLITEPNVAADAAAAFREMRQFEEVDLINSEAVTKSDPTAEEGSLYETVRAQANRLQTAV